MDCNEGTYTPEYGDDEPCEFKSADCIIHEDSIAYLGLPPNSTVTEVIQALTLSLIDARQRISQLEN